MWQYWWLHPHWPDSEPDVTPPSPSDSEWFDDPRLEEIFASWAESNHPSARGTGAKAPGPADEGRAEQPPGETGGGGSDAGGGEAAGEAGAGEGPGDEGTADAGDDLDAWSDAGAGLDWDVPDLRQAWTGAGTGPAPDPPEATGPEAQPEAPAEDGPWARDRDDVIPAPRRRRWGLRKR